VLSFKKDCIDFDKENLTPNIKSRLNRVLDFTDPIRQDFTQESKLGSLQVEKERTPMEMNQGKRGGCHVRGISYHYLQNLRQNRKLVFGRPVVQELPLRPLEGTDATSLTRLKEKRR